MLAKLVKGSAAANFAKKRDLQDRCFILPAEQKANLAAKAAMAKWYFVPRLPQFSLFVLS